MRTIRVTGKGEIRVKPDMTRILLSLEGTDRNYTEALRKSSEETEALKTLLTRFGFERSELKTLKFSIDTEYEHYEEKGIYKQRFVGYKFIHKMKVEFESDNELLGKILYALAHSAVKPEIHFLYTVKDPEKAKNELLGKAVTDAREKAEVLTRAAGVTLKDIESIDYSWQEVDFEYRPSDRGMIARSLELPMMGRAEGFDIDIEPDDIDVADTVTVIWEIG